MSLLLPGRLSGMLLIASVVVMGLICSNEALIRWLAAPPLNLNTRRNPACRSVNGVSWSADGRILLAQSRGDGHKDLSVGVFDLTDSTGLAFTSKDPIGIPILDATLSADACNMLLATDCDELWWVNLATMKIIEVAKTNGVSFNATAVSKDGSLLAGATVQGQIYLCQPAPGAFVVLNSTRSAAISRLRFSNDGHRLLANRNDGSFEVWDTKTGSLLRERRMPFCLTATAFLQEGARVISMNGGEGIQIWDVATGEVVWHTAHELQAQNIVCHLDASSDGSIVAWGCLDHRIIVWDLEHSRKRFEIDNPTVVLNISCSPDGKFLAVAGHEHLIRIYDMATGTEARQIDTRQRHGF